MVSIRSFAFGIEYDGVGVGDERRRRTGVTESLYRSVREFGRSLR